MAWFDDGMKLFTAVAHVFSEARERFRLAANVNNMPTGDQPRGDIDGN